MAITINIAARMEEAAKVHNACCIVSHVLADAIGDCDRLRPIGEETVKGISVPVRICEYRPTHC
jgi:adenylate cyclase